MVKLAAKILAFALILALAAPLFGTQIPVESLLNDLPPAAVSELTAEGEAFRYDRDGRGIALAPDHPSLGVIKKQHRELNPDAMVEGLYLIPYPEGSSGIDLNLYNITRNVRSISNVEYFSHRRNAVVPLFDDVYRIEDLRSKKRLEDSPVDRIPMFESILMHMKEVNLGSGYYESQYVYDGDSLGFFVRNVSPLRSLIKIVDTDNMLINIVIFPTEEGFLAYGYCGVKLSNRNLVFNMMDPFSGFYKRLYAMVTWVKNSLHGSDDDPFIGTPLDF